MTFQRRTFASKGGTHREPKARQENKNKNQTVYVDICFELQDSLHSTVLKLLVFAISLVDQNRDLRSIFCAKLFVSAALT